MNKKQIVIELQRVRNLLQEIFRHLDMPELETMGNLKADKKQWETIAQTWEIGWWAKADPPKDRDEAVEAALLMSRRLLARFELLHTQLGKSILEIGPGPTGKLMALEDTCGTLWAIEPLFDHYTKLGWPLLEHFNGCHAQAAEEFIPEFEEQCDTVISINALDHCYDIPQVLKNCFKYLKPGGELFISVDCNKPAGFDPTHPIKPDNIELYQAIEKAGFEITRVDSTLAMIEDLGYDKNSWGGGTAWHYWAKRPEE